ncbi:hypothetical protein ACVIYL_004696 [Bradyrhizobium sp. USDA 3315]
MPGRRRTGGNRLCMTTRKELTRAVGERYRSSDRAEKARILDEFVVITGLHRKHAMRLLRTPGGGKTARRARRRIYDEAELNALMLLWEASDRVCSKRLKALLPVLIETMERHGHLSLAPEIRTKLLAMSAATIDRALRPIREGSGPRRRRPAANALRHSIPISTSADWEDPAPGHDEADLVAHSGPSARGSFIQTLVLTELRKQLPFPLLGLDTDNDTVFMNETLKRVAIGQVFFYALPAVPQERSGYPDKLLRTLQRRLKSWRSERANALLFSTTNTARRISDEAATQ